MGMVTVRDLAESPIVSEVVVGEVNVELAEKVAEWTHSKKVATRKVDITDRRSLVGAISDVDAIANAAPFHLNLYVTKAAIEAGRHLTDACMLWKGDIVDDGVLPPELGIEPKPFFDELAKRSKNYRDC